jgi:hypothetical protein
MVRAGCTRNDGQWFTGSGRFEMRNTLRPGESVLCGGLQESSLMQRIGWMALYIRPWGNTCRYDNNAHLRNSEPIPIVPLTHPRLVPLYGVPARDGQVSMVITRSTLLGRLGSRRSGLVSIRFTGHSSPGPRRDDLTIYWSLGPFVRSFILPVDPGDICPPHPVPINR